MTTLWIARLYFFVRISDQTLAVRNALADAFANNASGQTRAHESGMFTNFIRLSLTGELPAQVAAWDTAVKPAMRDAIKTVIAALPAAATRYYVVANTDVPAQGWIDGELIQTDSPGAQARIGTIFTWQDALDDVFAERGLRVIEGDLQ